MFAGTVGGVVAASCFNIDCSYGNCECEPPYGPTTGTTSATTGTTAANTTANGGTTGTGTGMTTGTTTGGTGGDAGPIPAMCAPKPPANGMAVTLPMVVDQFFTPSGWMGDAFPHPPQMADDAGHPATPALDAALQMFPSPYSTDQDACTADIGGRSNANAKGRCYKLVFQPHPRNVGYGWVGIFWQNKMNNWGNLGGGLQVPAGAKSVSFWSRGKNGKEKVNFFTGEGSELDPCADFTSPQTLTLPVVGVQTLSTTWTHYTIDLCNGNPNNCTAANGALDYVTPSPLPGQTGYGNAMNFYGGVIGAFGFAVGDALLSTLGAAGGGTPTISDGGPDFDGGTCTGMMDPTGCRYATVVFYIDDIQWVTTAAM
jgi:hypothetical protein